MLAAAPPSPAISRADLEGIASKLVQMPAWGRSIDEAQTALVSIDLAGGSDHPKFREAAAQHSANKAQFRQLLNALTAGARVALLNNPGDDRLQSIVARIPDSSLQGTSSYANAVPAWNWTDIVIVLGWIATGIIALIAAAAGAIPLGIAAVIALVSLLVSGGYAWLNRGQGTRPDGTTPPTITDSIKSVADAAGGLGTLALIGFALFIFTRRPRRRNA